MGFFTTLEKLSEKYVEGFFRRNFAQHIQPAEIAKLLLREMRDNKNVSVSKIYVPNLYTVFLGDKDWHTIDSVRFSLSGELQDYLMKKASEKGYKMVGDVRVAFELDQELKLGTISLESAYSEELEPEIEPNPERSVDGKSATIVADRNGFYKGVQSNTLQDTLTKNRQVDMKPLFQLVQKIGSQEVRHYALGKHALIVGRRRVNEIYIEDNNVSRSHASIEYLEGAYYITDLGSTNGTFVNGLRVSRKKLAEGDLIKIGTTVLEYKVV